MFFSAVLISSGCAQIGLLPGSTSGAIVADGGGALAWWSRAMDAEPAARESMLRNAIRSKSAWRTAMLRSLPGSSDPLAPEISQEVLKGLLYRGLRDDEAALTRIRVAELQQHKVYQAQVVALRARLDRIVEIEKNIGNGR